MRTPTSILTAILLAAAIGFSPAALAEKGGHGKDKHEHSERGSGKHKKERDHSRRHHDDDSVTIVIGGSDKVLLRQYIVEDFHSHCPPGLAKKRNGCLPPGQAKKRYVIGDVLPGDVYWEPLPRHILTRLGSVRPGYQYVRVDKDVLLISEATKKVVDAVTLLSAVGN